MTPELLAMCELVMGLEDVKKIRRSELDGSTQAQMAFDRAQMAWDMAAIKYRRALQFDVESEACAI